MSPRWPQIYVTLLVWVSFSGLAAAQDPPTFAISPLVYVGPPAEVASVRAAVVQGARRYLEAWPEHITYVSEQQVRRKLRRSGFEQSQRIGKKWVNIGLTEYKNLKTADAIESLEQAVSTFESIGYPAIDRQAYAKALQYLTLSYLDLRQPNPTRPLDLLKNMMRADPARQFKRGFYPDTVVEFFDSARASLEEDLRGNGPRVQEARSWANTLDVSYFVFLSVLPKDDVFEVVFQAYDRNAGSYIAAEQVVIETASPEDVAWAANQAASRFLACITKSTQKNPGPIVKSRGESPWALELNFAYASFLGFPEPEVTSFGNYGASFGASYLLNQEFGLTSMMQVLTSLRDQDGFVIDDFTTIRGFAGAFLGYSFGPVRTEIGTLLEVATVGNILVCKDIDEIIPGCRDAGEFETYAFSALAGINVRPKITIQVLRSLQLTIAASATFYVLPLSERALNFPITGEAGFQYRF